MCVCVCQISEASVEETLVDDVVLSVLHVEVKKPALYTCLATNHHSGGANTVKATARVTVSGTPDLFKHAWLTFAPLLKPREI